MHVYQTQVESQIASTIEAELFAMGYELVRIRFKGGASRKTLQIMIDRVDGNPVKLADCEKVSKHTSVLLDVSDPIESRYSLEVSSPGLNRPITRHKDLVANVGNRIKLNLKVPVEGQKNFIGKLLGVTENQIVISDENMSKEFGLIVDNIQDANLVILEQKTPKKILNNKNNKKKRRRK